MRHRHAIHLTFLLSTVLALPACARSPETTTPAAAPPASSAGQSPVASADAAALPLVVVHKSPSCGCCGLWVEHMRGAGFPVEVRNTHALHAVKDEHGIPTNKGSCHTAVVDGYVIEGHVPAEDVKQLLAERPEARGLVLPGMPLGSPGMETPDGRVQPYTVELLAEDGSTTVFQEH